MSPIRGPPMIAARFAEHFQQHFADLVGRPVLVALSGGADSVALLELLGHPELRLTRHAAYVDHGQRPAEVAREIAFCRALCDRRSVPFAVLALAADDAPSAGREADWRRCRYRALLDHARALGLPFVATAHQHDDVAEGVLVQLLRGAGPRAMAGIAARAADGVVRPLLPFARAELVAFLEERGLAWCEDSSNRSTEHLRNLVRHRALPALEAVAPRLRSHLVALAGALADDEAALADELARRAAWVDPWAVDGGIPVAAVAELPAALRARWLHAQAERAGLGRVTRSQLLHLDRILAPGGPLTLTLGNRWRLRRARQRLWLEPPEPPRLETFTLPGHGEVALPLPSWFVRVGPAGGGTPADAPGYRWRPPADAGPITVRPARPGDAVDDGRPLRALVAERLPRHLRPAWPLFVCGATLAWIPGVWQGQSAAPHELEVEVLRR